MDENLILLIRSVVKVRAKLIGLALLGAILFSFLQVRSARPTFRADIKVYLRNTEGSPLSILGLDNYRNKDIIASQTELLETYPIYQKVLHLLPKPEKKVDTTPSMAQRVTRWFESLLFTYDVLEESETYQNPHFQWFQSIFSIYYSGEGNHFTVTAKHPNAKTAAQLAKAAARGLIELNIDIASKTISSVADLLNKRVIESDKRLAQSTAKITEFAKKNKISQGGGALAKKYSRYFQLETLVSEKQAELRQRTSSLEYSKKRANELLEKTKSSLLDSNYNRIQNLIGQIQRLEVTILQQRSKTNKKTVFLKSRLAKLKKQLSKELDENGGIKNADELQSALSTLNSNIAQEEMQINAIKFSLQNAKKDMRKYAKEVETLPEIEAQRNALMLRHEQLLQVHKVLTERYYKALSSSEVTYSKLYLIDDPTLNSNLLGMDKVRRLMTLLGVSVLIIVGSFVVYDLLSKTIFTTEQLSKLENTEYLGAIDHITKFKQKNLVKFFENDIHIARIAHTINRGLQKQAPHRTSNVISFCSVNQKSGKSASCLAIGACLSRTNGPVLILDFDFRAFNRSVTRYYHQHNASEGHVGSVENLISQIKNDTVASLPLTVAQLVDDGHDANVMINYLRHSFEEDLELLKKHFRYILIDLAPLVFLDAIMTVEKSNQIVCCCPEGRVKTRELLDLTEALVKAKDPEARILTLLTDSRMKLNHTGYYAYQAYMRKYSTKRSAA